MKPKIITPKFWPVSEERILEQINRIKKGRVEKIGRSAGGRPLYGVVYEPDSFSHVFGIIAGMHGHEPGGVAAALNLINVLEEGRDLKNTKWDGLFNKIKFVIIPLLNPDARCRCPDSFVGLSHKDVQIYCDGLDLQRRIVKRKKSIIIKKTFILGGLYNDKGIDILNYGNGKKKDYKYCPEMAYSVDFFLREGVEYFINLHAHCFNIMFYAPHNCIKEEEMRKELYITQAVRRKGEKAGYHFAMTEYENNPRDEYRVKIPCDLLVYNHCGAVPFLVECPQGTLDSYRCFYKGKEREIRDPAYNHEKIVSSYLFVVQEINRIILNPERNICKSRKRSEVDPILRRG